jgi:hypothetical protein
MMLSICKTNQIKKRKQIMEGLNDFEDSIQLECDGWLDRCYHMSIDNVYF